MNTDYITSLEDFLNKKFKQKNSLNSNEEEEDNNTIFSTHKDVKDVKLKDFKILKVIGRGGYGKVCLVEYLPTHEIYAMKSMKKDILIEQEQVQNTLLEKEILQNIDYPFLCGLVFCFQTVERIYFVMPFISGGELFQHLKKRGTLSEEKIRFYGAQIALAIEYLHKRGIIYRDIKPENILIDEQGYIKLTDFGFSKKLKDNEMAMTFCGTPEYLAPEIITMQGHDQMVDWWSFGILLYEMLYGYPPFYVKNVNTMYNMIRKSPVKFSEEVEPSEDMKDIIQKLLDKDPNKRLGNLKGIEEIKNHPFFAKIDFDLIEQKKITAPFIPEINNITDVQNFDEEFTNEKVENSFIAKKNMKLIKKNQKMFKDF